MLNKKGFIAVLLLLNITMVKAGVVVLNGLTHRYTVEHGITYKGVISMQNTGDIPQDVRIYLNDYAYQASGEIFYSEPGKTNRSNSLWVHLNADYVTLQPKEKYELLYEITVPDETVIDGSYWSVVMIEPIDEIVPNDAIKGDVRMRSKVRYAIQMITTINEGTALSALEFQNVHTTNQNGKRLLSIDILNKGGLYHKVTASAELYDNREGTEMGLFNSSIKSLLPNTSKRFYIDISSVPEGSYSIVLLADGGDENIFGLNIELIIEDG